MKSAPIMSLVEIAESVQYGYTASASDSEVGPKFLRITDIVPPQIDWANVPYCVIDEKNFNKCSLEPGDIVIARTGATVGYAKLIRDNEPSVFASYLVRVRVDPEKADPGYVGRIVESDVYKRFVLSRVGGAAQPNANAKVLSSFRLPIPERAVQQRIASILSAYDDLIENNRRRIQLLEQAARLLYKEWFVHLRFPGHEHVKIIDGVPEGWERTTVPEVIEVNPMEATPRGTPIRYVPMAGLSTTGMSVELSVSEMRAKSTPVRFRNGDTLFARITPCLENGKTGFANFLHGDEVACGSTEFIVLRGRSVSSFFTYCFARTYDFRETAIKSMIGSSGRQRVQTSCFNDFVVALPPRMLLEQFDQRCEPIFRQIGGLSGQVQSLTQARDLLLPRLMNGDIPV